VRREGDGWHLDAGGKSFGPYDCVVEAAPAHAAAGHFTGTELSRLLGGIPYVPMAVIVLALDRNQVKHPLSGFGMLTPSLENRRLLGVLWSTSIFRGRAPEGKVMLRCMAGGAADPGINELSDTDLVRICLEELAPLYGMSGHPERTWVIRHEKAIAQYEPGHLARLRAIEDALRDMPGLFLTGSSYRGVSTNHCIAEAETTAGSALDYLAARHAAQESRSAAGVGAARVATG
jgi:oxygen-dependent protoporphyrinogen oxidase